MELVQKLARRFWRWQLVPDQTPHAIPAQTGEVIQTFSSGSIEDDKTLHVAGFIQAALALLNTHMAPDASRQVQTSERLHQQRNPGQRGQVLFAVSFVIIESQRLLGRGNTFCSHLAAFYGLPSPNRCELPTLPHPSGLDSNRYSTSPTDGLARHHLFFALVAPANGLRRIGVGGIVRAVVVMRRHDQRLPFSTRTGSLSDIPAAS